MRERDTNWRSSAKLQAALFAALVIVAILLDNRHNQILYDHALSICEVTIVAALGGRIGMMIQESRMSNLEQGLFNYTPAPKDVDDGSVS